MSEIVFKKGDRVMFSKEFREHYEDTINIKRWVDEMPDLMSRPYLTIRSVSKTTKGEVQYVIEEHPRGVWLPRNFHPHIIECLDEDLFQI